MNHSAQDIIEKLGLEPLTFEGGYYKRTYTSEDNLSTQELPDRYANTKSKSYCSAIYYLLTPDTYSRIHRLPTDEIFHFYLGDPVEMVQINNEEVETIILGNQIMTGQQPQVIVPKGTWQGGRLMNGGKFALMGTTMSPAFDIEDFELPDNSSAFVKKYPSVYHSIIQELL